MLDSAYRFSKQNRSHHRKHFSILKSNFKIFCFLVGGVVLAGCNTREMQDASENNVVTQTKKASAGNAGSTAEEKMSKTHLVRAAITAEGMQVDELSEKDIHSIEWMEPRKAKQIDAAKDWQVFHNFQYRRVRSRRV